MQQYKKLTTEQVRHLIQPTGGKKEKSDSAASYRLQMANFINLCVLVAICCTFTVHYATSAPSGIRARILHSNAGKYVLGTKTPNGEPAILEATGAPLG